MKKKLLCIAALTAMGLAGSAWGETVVASAPIQVSAQLGGASCSISTTTLDFGSVTIPIPLTNAESSITVTCPEAAPYQVILSNGLYFDASRRMKATTADYIYYALYQDTGRQMLWDQSTPYFGTGTGAPQVLPVYGQIPLGQTTSVQGTYTDIVVASINF